MLCKMLLLDTFRETPTIIFLNKKDLLRKKTQESNDDVAYVDNFNNKTHF